MTRIRPITDLKDTNEISDMCHASNEPVFITKNDHEDLVVMSIEAFDSMHVDRELDAVIVEAEAEYASDDRSLADARKSLSSLKGRHFGYKYTVK
ncbi:MAG: type II toxin-antitoxin system Phd/YefM family antitoxin, partial [Clostridiales Family XIII bacterium]|nr:type II toxin-antitoxin system Phd/YefM family antitoxin [Clostridiales Family XIII bacterium]